MPNPTANPTGTPKAIHDQSWEKMPMTAPINAPANAPNAIQTPTARDLLFIFCLLLIDFISHQRRANHQRFHRRLNFDHGMVHARRETAEFARTDGKPFPFDVHDQRTAQDNKTFIAQQVFVRNFAQSDPALVRIVVSNLQLARYKTNSVPRHGTGQESGMLRKFAVMKMSHLVCSLNVNCQTLLSLVQENRNSIRSHQNE